jgi:NCS1 family nucleobase:cation symporter-1
MKTSRPLRQRSAPGAGITSALWVGMVMCIPAYTLSASLIDSGMSGYQAVLTVFLANAIVLLPMLLIGHAGTKYGIPYAVLARASFGTMGARCRR